MKTKNRQGVLGLDTTKAVMISFLILSITGIAILLALSSLGNSSVADSIDVRTSAITVTNETEGNANITGYTLSGYNSSWSGISITTVWADDSGAYNVTVPLANITVSNVGVVTNNTVITYSNLSLSYGYTYTYNLGRVSSIQNNVSSGLTTFFASTGTVFSILVVVVIILAISIIIWAVGRFGTNAEQQEPISL